MPEKLVDICHRHSYSALLRHQQGLSSLASVGGLEAFLTRPKSTGRSRDGFMRVVMTEAGKGGESQARQTRKYRPGLTPVWIQIHELSCRPLF